MNLGGLIARYWRVGVILVIGIVLMLWVGIVIESTTGVLWAGAIIGILIGFAIAAEQRREATREAKKQQHKRRR